MQEVTAILYNSRDKYMLSPCTAQRKVLSSFLSLANVHPPHPPLRSQWIVIELCEDVGVDQIALGNFEYFSSMFRDFQVLGSRKYPVSHWSLVGNFTAKNIRELQSFGLAPEQPVQWFKYV